MDRDGSLPFIDEHSVRVAAPAAVVWRAVVAQITGGTFAAPGTLAFLLGTEPRHAAGLPLRTGSTLPGFAAVEVTPPQHIRLTGRHRFSRYELVLTLTEQDGATTLRARSNAEFPGGRGFLYRAAVIGSGAHRTIMRRFLRTVRRDAERAARADVRGGASRRS